MALPLLQKRPAQAYARIVHLASQVSTHQAFSWLHLHQPQVLTWQRELLAIPAPPFGEGARGAWFIERFRDLGLRDAHLDGAGNALALLGPASALHNPGTPMVLLSAHLDTVFPAGTDCTPRLDDETGVLHGPGACDNGAGLAALLALAAALRHAQIETEIPILFAANVGEEGEGDLRGMRFLLGEGPFAKRIAAALALEGAGTSATVTRALGSVRLRVRLTGPGGHSWTDAGTPNPILLLARGLTDLAARLPAPAPGAPQRSTFNPGQIAGGSSINSIPAEAEVLLDLRSTDAGLLPALELEVHRTMEHVVARAGGTPAGVGLQIERIGLRPAAALPEDSSLLATLRAVDRHLSLPTDLRLGSTDANLPLSLGVPAAALAAGGSGGGIHTLAEWYNPAGRETALRRILLVLLDTARITATGCGAEQE